MCIRDRSGAGKSTALKMLEDVGYFCVDNLPVPLIPKMADLLRVPGTEINKAAIGVDIRSGQSFSELEKVLGQLDVAGMKYEILYLECVDDVLIKRYKETRRSHPLSGNEDVYKRQLLPCMKCDDCQNGNFSLCKHYSFIGSRQQGSNADYVVIPEQNAVVLDESVSYEQGAMFEPSTVALHGVIQNDYKGGEYVAVLGGGTIGMFTMQWTKIFGAKKVVVFDISDERLDLALRLGADEVINTTKESYMEQALALTKGKGYAYVFETAGQVPTCLLYTSRCV